MARTDSVTGRMRVMGRMAASILVLAALSYSTPSFAAAKTQPGAGANWERHGGGMFATDYSRLDQIDTANVKRLGLAWSLDLPGQHLLEATPLAVNGVLYFTGSESVVYAVDAASGKLLWKYDPQVWKHHPAKMKYIMPVNRGVAYAHGRIFVGTLDTRLIALDAKTGKVLWSVETTPPQSPQNITGAPRTFDGKVIIGNSGADFGARGYVTAYDQKTGKEVWRFYTAPGTPAENKGHPAQIRAAKTWPAGYWKSGTGGAPWDSITFDPELNRIYFGTGNAEIYMSDKKDAKRYDRLYTSSIVAVDANTGHYLWHYQLDPGGGSDYDAAEQITLADLTIAGKPRKVVMTAPKNGFFYVIDRTNGKLISAKKLGKVTWAKRIDLKTGRPVLQPPLSDGPNSIMIWPSPIGAHNYQSMSFSPKTGLVYIPYMQVGVRYTRIASKADTGAAAFANVIITPAIKDAQDGKGALLAWDPITQKARWRVEHNGIWNGGTLATAGNLVFQGTADGHFNAYDARTGKELWHFNAGLGIVAAPISYEVNGKQYVSVLTGPGGAWGRVIYAGWKFNAQPRRLLTFELGAKAVLPPTAPPDMKLHPLDVPSLHINKKQAKMGHVLYTMHCSSCHGANLFSAGSPAPDLRESQIALQFDNLWTVVHDGALMELGMPRFKELKRRQAHAIYEYIRAGARDALKKEHHLPQ